MKIFTQKTLLILYSNNIKNLFISILHGYINIKLHLTHTPEPINIGEYWSMYTYLHIPISTVPVHVYIEADHRGKVSFLTQTLPAIDT